ncbi:GNAT family N-acetyltransferase, partial [Glaesserella parasuis]|uniref:GNAT family N-acetyltransferase n=1 Tax=Glaesserella parasuis TaxID=738 RepID=UPI001BE4D557
IKRTKPCGIQNSVLELNQSNFLGSDHSYSQFYSRAAYDGSREISFYLDKAVHGKGIGKACVNFLIEQMPNYQLHTLLAFVFGNNDQSLGLLNKMGFEIWGKLPQVADMETDFEDLVILGLKQGVCGN